MSEGVKKKQRSGYVKNEKRGEGEEREDKEVEKEGKGGREGRKKRGGCRRLECAFTSD